MGISGLIDADEGGGDSGVDFSPGASPGNLPSGNTVDPAFETTKDFLADSDPPVSHNGVNPGESLGIIFDLAGVVDGDETYYGTYSDVINELNNGDLRIGIHVQGFSSGGSEAFVNGGKTTITELGVPDPGILHCAFLLGSGIIGLVGYTGLRFRHKRI